MSVKTIRNWQNKHTGIPGLGVRISKGINQTSSFWSFQDWFVPLTIYEGEQACGQLVCGEVVSWKVNLAPGLCSEEPSQPSMSSEQISNLRSISYMYISICKQSKQIQDSKKKESAWTTFEETVITCFVAWNGMLCRTRTPSMKSSRSPWALGSKSLWINGLAATERYVQDKIQTRFFGTTCQCWIRSKTAMTGRWCMNYCLSGSGKHTAKVQGYKEEEKGKKWKNIQQHVGNMLQHVASKSTALRPREVLNSMLRQGPVQMHWYLVGYAGKNFCLTCAFADDHIIYIYVYEYSIHIKLNAATPCQSQSIFEGSLEH